MPPVGVYPCAARDAEIWRLFDGEHKTRDAIAALMGLVPAPVGEAIRRWRKREGMVAKPRGARLRVLDAIAKGDEPDPLDMDVPPPSRPLCRCGLSIDASHTPETCDMRTYTTRMAMARRAL